MPTICLAVVVCALGAVTGCGNSDPSSETIVLPPPPPPVPEQAESRSAASELAEADLGHQVGAKHPLTRKFELLLKSIATKAADRPSEESMLLLLPVAQRCVAEEQRSDQLIDVAEGVDACLLDGKTGMKLDEAIALYVAYRNNLPTRGTKESRLRIIRAMGRATQDLEQKGESR